MQRDRRRLYHCRAITGFHDQVATQATHRTNDTGPHVHPRSYDHAPDLLERLHDVRVVRALEKPERPPVVRGGNRELGDRAVRVSAAGAREPDWLHADEP